MSGPRVLTCVYCGHEFPQDTPAHGADILTEHIRQCDKHPMPEVDRVNTVNAIQALLQTL